MTNICGGGPSGTKPGVAEQIIYAGSALELYLGKKNLGWMSLLVPLIGVISYDAIQLCGTDPPAMPSWTRADYDAVLKLDMSGPFQTALGKFRDTVLNLLWYDLCQCNNPPQPAPPANPGEPAGHGLARSVYGGNPLATAQVCYQLTIADSPYCQALQPVTFEFDFFNVNATQHVAQNYTLNGAGSLTQTVPYDPVYAYPNLDLHFGPPCNIDLNVGGFDTFRKVDQPAYWVLEMHQYPSTQGPYPLVGASWALYCGAGAAPGAAGGGCCADPNIYGLLRQVWSMLQLLQRFDVPFAYIPGPSHPNLSGNGQFSIQGDVGVAVQLTTIPAGKGSVTGDPSALFDIGFVTLGTSDGWARSVELTHNPQLILPIAPAHTLLGYTLQPGVVATINEFKPEVSF